VLPVIFSTENGNSYCYSVSWRTSFFSHPVLSYAIDPNSSLLDKLFEILNKEEDVRYYEEFHEFLKAGGVLDEIDQSELVTGEISNSLIEDQFAATRQVVFETTEACNLRCTYCGYSDVYSEFKDHGRWERKDTTKASFEQVKPFIDDLLKAVNGPRNKGVNSRLAFSFYGGEPLMNFNFIRETVDYIKTLHFRKNRIAFTMTTNAVLLKKHLKFLIDHNFKLLVSLDGNAESMKYRPFHNGKPSAFIIDENLEYIRNTQPYFFENNIEFNAVLHDKNSVASLYDFFWEKYQKVPKIAELSSSGISDSGAEKFSKMNKKIQSSINDEHSEIFDIEEIKIGLPLSKGLVSFLKNQTFNSFNTPQDLYKESFRKFIPTGSCTPFAKKIYLSVTGDMLPCEKVDRKYAMGSLIDDGYSNSELLKEKYNSWYNKASESCGTCYNAFNCNQCFMSSDTILKSNYECPSYSDREKKAKHLSKLFSHFEDNPSLYRTYESDIVIT
jgi:uncharacterized protein